MGKKPERDEKKRLKLTTDWETAAEKLLRMPPKAIPPRAKKPRKSPSPNAK